MPTMERRKRTGLVQIAFEVPHEVRSGTKQTAKKRGQTIREYLTDLMMREQEKEEARK